jgi:Peptidase C1-like family
MQAAHNLDTSFELSQSYLFFYDKIERANFFLENILATAHEDVGSRLVQFLLSAPGARWRGSARCVCLCVCGMCGVGCHDARDSWRRGPVEHVRGPRRKVS